MNAPYRLLSLVQRNFLLPCVQLKHGFMIENHSTTTPAPPITAGS